MSYNFSDVSRNSNGFNKRSLVLHVRSAGHLGRCLAGSHHLHLRGSLSRHGRLHLHLLLLSYISDLLLGIEELENLGDLLLKELGFSDKFVEIGHTIKKTSRNLSSHLAVNVLNREKDRVSNELGFIFSRLESIELGKVHSWESHLCGLSILLSLLLSRSHHVVRREVVLVHDRLVVLVLSLITTLVSVSLVTATSLVLIATTTSLVVVSSVHVVVTTVLLVIVLLGHVLVELLW